MTAIDPAAVHADPDGGIRWDLHTGEVLRADPVISVSAAVFDQLIYRDTADASEGDPRIELCGRVGGLALTRWTFTNAEHLYRVHSYDPDTDCYLLVWPD